MISWTTINKSVCTDDWSITIKKMVILLEKCNTCFYQDFQCLTQNPFKIETESIIVQHQVIQVNFRSHLHNGIEQNQIVCFYHVPQTFRVNLRLVIVNELFARNKCNIWNLNGCNGIRTCNYLFRKRTLSQLVMIASLAKWLSIHLRTKWLWVPIPLQSAKSKHEKSKAEKDKSRS